MELIAIALLAGAILISATLVVLRVAQRKNVEKSKLQPLVGVVLPREKNDA